MVKVISISNTDRTCFYKKLSTEGYYFHGSDEAYKIVKENFKEMPPKHDVEGDYYNTPMLGKGFYFTTVFKKANKFSNLVLACKLEFKNPLFVETSIDDNTEKFKEYDAIICKGRRSVKPSDLVVDCHFKTPSQQDNPNSPLAHDEIVIKDNGLIKCCFIILTE